MSYGSTFPLWRDAAGQAWHDYVRHAFVEGLGAGTLPRRAFLGYLVQDYVFLVHFSRAWALAVTKADTIGEMRTCSEMVQSLIGDEMSLHVRTCAAEGIPEAELFAATEAPANLAYTRYVLDAGHSGDFLDLLAALAPCVFGYGEIGTRLLGQAGETPYRDWIETYGGPEYQDVCHGIGALLDGAVARRLGRSPQDAPQWARLEARFATATRLEAGFWDMGLAA